MYGNVKLRKEKLNRLKPVGGMAECDKWSNVK